MYNEQDLLPMWIESWLAVPFINKIYLVDGESTDRSVDIAKSYGNRVSVITIPWKNDFARQRNVAIKLAKTEWLMQPDIDEMPCKSNVENVIRELESKDTNLQIALPYLKFYNFNTLWFFTDGNTPSIVDENKNIFKAGYKSTLTIFRKNNLKGYRNSLHEMPIVDNSSKNIQLGETCDPSVHFVCGHYDQAKHFFQAKNNHTSVELEMGLKRVRYRLINPVIYEGKVYDNEWAMEAINQYNSGNDSMMKELGEKQLNSFKKQHKILTNFPASYLNGDPVKKYYIT
jgi:glycosyltransferase involved in cell wall biosynthesis